MFNASKSKQNDMEISGAFGDSISDIHFNQKQDFIAAANWDKTVKIYEITLNASIPKTEFAFDGPDGTKLAAGSCDKTAKVFDITTGQSVKCASHDEAIKNVHWCDANQTVLITGSWDKTIKYWDLRSPGPLSQVNLGEKVFSLDVHFPLMAVATSERKIFVFDLNNPTTPYKVDSSPLKFQYKTIACSINSNAYALGSIEGRSSFQYVEDGERSKNFAFKCHRTDKEAYSVNSISFHPIYGSLSTAGSDGNIHFWDKDSKTKLKSLNDLGGSITATSFNGRGDLFAYSIGYDWSKGHAFYDKTHKNAIFIHQVQSDEVKPKNYQTSIGFC